MNTDFQAHLEGPVNTDFKAHLEGPENPQLYDPVNTDFRPVLKAQWTLSFMTQWTLILGPSWRPSEPSALWPREYWFLGPVNTVWRPSEHCFFFLSCQKVFQTQESISQREGKSPQIVQTCTCYKHKSHFITRVQTRRKALDRRDFIWSLPVVISYQNYSYFQTAVHPGHCLRIFKIQFIETQLIIHENCSKLPYNWLGGGKKLVVFTVTCQENKWVGRSEFYFQLKHTFWLIQRRHCIYNGKKKLKFLIVSANFVFFEFLTLVPVFVLYWVGRSGYSKHI